MPFSSLTVVMLVGSSVTFSLLHLGCVAEKIRPDSAQCGSAGWGGGGVLSDFTGVNERGEKSVAYTSLRQDCNTNTHSAVTTQRPHPGNYAGPFSSSRPCSGILHEAEVSM